MESLLIDIRYMLKGFNDLKFLLGDTCQITKFILAIPIYNQVANVVDEALIHRDICIFCASKLLIVHKDSTSMGEMILFILRANGCHLKTISLFNNGTLRTGQHTQTIGKIVTKSLTGQGEMQ